MGTEINNLVVCSRSECVESSLKYYKYAFYSISSFYSIYLDIIQDVDIPLYDVDGKYEFSMELARLGSSNDYLIVLVNSSSLVARIGSRRIKIVGLESYKSYRVGDCIKVAISLPKK